MLKEKKWRLEKGGASNFETGMWQRKSHRDWNVEK